MIMWAVLCIMYYVFDSFAMAQGFCDEEYKALQDQYRILKMAYALHLKV